VADMSGVSSIPCNYNGYKLKSRLEARWMNVLEYFSIKYLYEWQPVDLDGVWYEPDFYFPKLQTYFEVKGPLKNNVEKTRLLALHYKSYEFDPEFLVLIGDEEGNIYGFSEVSMEFNKECSLFGCKECGEYWLAPDEGSFRCRNKNCGAYDGDHHLRDCIPYHCLPTFILELMKGVKF
jgi:hypothetical protein